MKYTGKEFESNNYGKFIVTEYRTYRDVTIEFVSTGYKKKTNMTAVKRGKVMDPLSPSFCGIGYLGVGRHKACENSKESKAYRTWQRMLQRCYSTASLKNDKCYQDCTVCDEWHNFQNFAEWFELNYSDGLVLDKDIKMPGNREYSPDACLFVTARENAIASNSKHV